MTISLVVPAVLSLYNELVAKVPTLSHLKGMARVLRDSLKRRFLGIFARVGMGHSMDLATEPFSDKAYFVAAILDPNIKLQWVDEDVIFIDDLDDDDKKEEIKTELKGIHTSKLEKLHV